MRIGIITCEAFPDLYEDDVLLRRGLEAAGHHVTPLIWTKPIADDVELLLVRNPWDWFKHRERFRAFLDSLHTVKARVVNPPRMLSDFADKTYLPKLAARRASAARRSWNQEAGEIPPTKS